MSDRCRTILQYSPLAYIKIGEIEVALRPSMIREDIWTIHFASTVFVLRIRNKYGKAETSNATAATCQAKEMEIELAR